MSIIKDLTGPAIWAAIVIGSLVLFAWFMRDTSDAMADWQAFCQPSFTADQCKVLYAVKMDSDIPSSDRIVVQNTPTLQPKLGLSR